jgi:Fe2+ transport system protein B
MFLINVSNQLIRQVQVRGQRNALPVLFKSDAWSTSMLRMIGMGDSNQKRLGHANDICNTCGIEIDFDSFNQTTEMSLKKTLNIQKRNLKEFESVTAEFKSASSSQDVLRQIEHVESQMKKGKRRKQSKEVENLKDSEINCPALILHSPEDGEFEHDIHAIHATKILTKSILEVKITEIRILGFS